MVISATGWTVAQLDATPWPDVLDLLDYWKSVPPIYIQMRRFTAWMGMKTETTTDLRYSTEDEIDAGFKEFTR